MISEGWIESVEGELLLLKTCVAFTRDSCNTMFGELRRNEQGNNVFAKLKKM